MRRVVGALVGGALLGMVVALAWGSASAPAARGIVIAGVDDFAFASMDVDYTLEREDDGTSTLTVVETFVAEFPEFDQNRGMRRFIPEWDGDVPLFPTMVSLTDESGDPRAQETESEDGYLVVTSRADDYVHGSQTYVFTYTMRNVVRHFTNTGADEFYWDVNGKDWPQPFGRVTATVHLDAELADALTGGTACYWGYSGATDTCPIAVEPGPDGGATVEAGQAEISPHQTMTIAVGFEAGTFTPFDASFLASPWGWLQGFAGLLVAGSLTGGIVIRSRRLRDEPGRPFIIAEYTPPPQVDALESAVLLGLTTKAIPAEVLEQAVVGSIRIVEGDRKFWGGVKLQAQLIDPARADGDGRMLLEGLFGTSMTPGEVFEFGSTDTRFSSAAQKILKAATSELQRRGLRRRVPGGVRAWPTLGAVLGAALVWVLGFVALQNGVNWLVPVGLMAASALAVFIVGGLVSRKPLTALGAQVRDHLAGLRMFIEWAEADRIRMLQSPTGAERVPVDVDDPRQMLKLYETLLPYAVVFGQEKEWAKQLVVLYGEGNSPYWYAGTHGFSASSFSSGIGTLSSSASSSSSSGGSGGGGSAGGGGGGGGGGGV